MDGSGIYEEKERQKGWNLQQKEPVEEAERNMKKITDKEEKVDISLRARLFCILSSIFKAIDTESKDQLG